MLNNQRVSVVPKLQLLEPKKREFTLWQFNIAIENCHYGEFSHWTWWFSTAMLNYRRVSKSTQTIAEFLAKTLMFLPSILHWQETKTSYGCVWGYDTYIYICIYMSWHGKMTWIYLTLWNSIWVCLKEARFQRTISMFSFARSICVGLDIWWFPEMGVPLKIMHL